jgi:hypothetical protein
MPAKFPLGHVVITANAQATLNPADIQPALARHHSGDWGDLDEHDRRANEASLTAYDSCRHTLTGNASNSGSSRKPIARRPRSSCLKTTDSPTT